MESLVFYYPTGHERHFERGHPERPERVESIRQAFTQAGLWEAFPHLEPLQLPRPALEAVHTPAYLDELALASQRAESLDMDTYTTPASWQLALNAAGGAAATAAAVWRGVARRGFALTRPPGHHAMRAQGMGFCLLNNVAIATRFLLNGAVKNLIPPERLAIVDLDLHHGNGTQDIFWRNEQVLYISTHQSPLYPGTGSLHERGEGPGFGLTANIPLPPGTGDQGFRFAMSDLILPLLEHFQPQMILISYGFDAHWRDPLGSLRLSAQAFGTLIRALANWADARCGGKIALFLEGGYDLVAGQACSLAAAAALLGRPWNDPLGPSPLPETDGWKRVIEQAIQMWQIPAGIRLGGQA
jgi:acetoin utilization deacetylase AcuC-like enzyme